MSFTHRVLPESGGRQRTVLRTIRILKEHDEFLQKYAESKGLSINVILAGIIKKFVDWDAITSDISMSTLPREIFRELFAAIPEETLAKIGESVGSANVKDFIIFLYGECTYETYKMYNDLFAKYCGLGSYALRHDGRDYHMTLLHDLGRGWSTFVKHMGTKEMQSIFKVTPSSVEVTERSVVARWHSP